jgi:hypothetical protein
MALYPSGVAIGVSGEAQTPPPTHTTSAVPVETVEQLVWIGVEA